MGVTLYDVEDLLDEIETLLKAKLNTKLTQIENLKIAQGKGVGLTLPKYQFSANAYYQQNWSDKILSRSPAIFYGLETIQATGSGSATLELYKIFVEVVMVDNGMDANGKRRLLRYSRAIREVFQENYDALSWNTKTNIETVRPLSFTIDGNTSEEIRVGGVSIVTGLA